MEYFKYPNKDPWKIETGAAKRSQMAIKTPLREIRDAVVCAIAPDTYQVYQIRQTSTSRHEQTFSRCCTWQICACASYRKSRGLSPSEPLPHGFTFYELSSIFPSFSRLVLVLVPVLVHRQSDTKWLATLSKLSPLVCKMTNRFHYVGSHVRWLVRFLLKWLAASHSELFPRKNSL